MPRIWWEMTMKRLVGDRDEQTILSREWTKLIRAHDYNHLSIWIACSSKLFFAFSLQTFSDVHCDKIKEKLMNRDFFFGARIILNQKWKSFFISLRWFLPIWSNDMKVKQLLKKSLLQWIYLFVRNFLLRSIKFL